MEVTQDQLVELVQKASEHLGVSRNEAIAHGLRLVLSTAPPNYKTRQLVSTAKQLERDRGSFTMDELLDEAFQDQPIYSPHKVKILAAQVLRTVGYERRQFRRKGDRPLLWFRPVGSLED
tara:strand:+ start:190 stop:549 length:360 start_codon:yes stop_codon:yes gene_type:complete